MKQLLGKAPGVASAGARAPVPEVVKSLDQLSKEDQSKVLSLIETIQEPYDTAYRNAVVRSLEGRNFGAGNQWIRWNQDDARFDPSYVVDDTRENENPDSSPPVVINVYGKKQREFCALMSGSSINLVYSPQDANKEEDRDAADFLQKAVERFERRNEIQEKQAQEARVAFTDAYVCLYFAHRKDKAKYGSHTEDIEEERETVLSEESVAPDGTLIPAVTAKIPIKVDEREVIHGEEELDIYGVAECKTPCTLLKQQDMPYVEIQTDIPVARLRHTYGKAADGIAGLESGNNNEGSAQGGDSLARYTRLVTSNATTNDQGVADTSGRGLVTLRKTWLRDWAFCHLVTEADRERFRKMFPNGGYFCHANGKMLDACNESMDDHIVLWNPVPAPSIAGPSVGEAVVPIQREGNTLAEIELQTRKFQVPSALVDTSMLDPEAYANTRVQPATMIPVVVPDGKSIGDCAVWSAIPQIDPQTARTRNELLFTMADDLTGIYNSTVGAPADRKSTATEYTESRDASMGILGLPFRGMKAAHARMAMALKRLIIESRSKEEVLTLPKENEDGWENENIPVQKLIGAVDVYPDANEDVPLTWTQKKNFVTSLFSSEIPEHRQIVFSPDNYDIVSPYMTLAGMHLPNEGAWRQQEWEISQLVGSKPLVGQVDPATGQPSMEPSVPIDPDFDNHQIHIQKVQAWLESEEGRKAKQSNPEGWQNARLHGLRHVQYIQQLQMQQAQAQAAAQQPKQPPQAQ